MNIAAVAAPVQHTIDTPYMVGPVHCYTVDLGGELALFDTGPPTEDCKHYLKTSIDLDRLRHVIITHCHLDHYGQSAWLERNSAARVYLPYRDSLKIRHHDVRLEMMYELLAEMGFDNDYLTVLRESFYKGVLFPPPPETYYIAEHDLPEHLGITVYDCAGHSQSDLVYGTGEWAVTGDTLLRNIYQSPLLDIDLEAGTRFNNYQAYCKTLLRLAALRGKQILPGHRHHIDSVDETITFYVTKTLHRLQFLKKRIRELSVAEIIDQVFGKQMSDPVQIYLKASEIVFMKDLLEDPQSLRTSLEQIGLFDPVEQDFLLVSG